MVKATWQGNAAQNIIKEIAETFEDSCRTEVQNNLQEFLDSVKIKRLKFRTKGNVEVPRFNIYTNGQLIPDDEIWFNICDSLAKLTYASPMQGQGYTEASPSTCNICHGVDHPTSMCKFPEIEGWFGPTRDSVGRAPPPRMVANMDEGHITTAKEDSKNNYTLRTY
jgi:hypothetical protein